MNYIKCGKRKGLDFYTSAVFYFYRSLIDTDTYEISCRKWMEKISELRNNGLIGEKDFNSVNYLFAQADIDFKMIIPGEHLIKQLIENSGLRIVSKVHGDDHFPFIKNCPIYVMTKEGKHD